MTARRTFPVFLILVLAFFAAPLAYAQVSLTTLGTPYTQNFDTLPASGSATWTNNSNIPGWFHARTGTGTTIVANNGSSNAGNLYSYGTGTATDRALGSLGSGNAAVGNLFWGVRLQNNTGATITQLDVTYTGEQWRNSAAAAQTVAFSYLVGSPTVTGSLAEFQSAGVAVAALDFTSPITGGAAGALDGNLAANRVTLTFSITGLSIPNGTEVMLRWSDPDHTGADHGLSIDDFAVTPQGGPPTPTLNVGDVTLAEGNPPGTTTFNFQVTLSVAAGPSGVSFNWQTADDTATLADNDYVQVTSTPVTITSGNNSATLAVTVNRDTTPEPNETFFVNISGVTNATAGDVQGLGTINNDDVTLTPIHDIQGPGNSSPLSGSVTTTGIVTGLKTNGYFIQEPDASVDADPATSEGIFVFTSSAPPAAAAVGNLVQVTGTIAEFVPTQDLLQPPLTELTSPTTVQLSTGNPLPAAIPLTPTFPDPAGPFDQLERLEGMRVSVASLTTSSPTLGNSVNETNATQTSNGVFNGVVTGVARPAREPGIQAPDPAPSGGSIPPIPRFDANPEMIRVDSDGLVGAPTLDVDTGTVVTGLIGPLDYGFRHYTILPDPTLPAPVAAGGITPTAASVPTAKEFTVAAYNVERFFDTNNDPAIGEPVLTATAYGNRLNKLSLGIRNHLLFPDIIGMVEVEDLNTIQDIADRVNNDAVTASQPNPMYVGYLQEGNDVGGIDVGFLVKTAIVTGATPRVTVNAVVQENAGEQFVNMDASTEDLNDRPPLRLDATINAANGASYPVTVFVVHQRSLIGVNDESAGSFGWPTVGSRVRAKRQAQANSLANLIQTRQTNNPAENIILVGDFNAYEFNDGLADVMNTLHGTPPPDNQTAVPGDGVDLVNPNLDNLYDTPPPGERYSYVFDGQMQNIDHGVVNAALIASTTARRLEHPRINTDFRAVDRNDANTPRHLSDHDPLVGYYEVQAFASADVALTKTLDTAGPYFEGQSVTYTINVANAGPDPATNIQVTDTPTNLSITSVSGACASLPCTIASLAVGANTNITVTATITAAGAFDNSATADADEADPNTANNTDNTGNGGTAAASADVSITKTLDTAGPYFEGQSVTYTINVANAGPSTATGIDVTDTPTNLTITGVSGACASLPCVIASLASGANTNITVTATINAPGTFDNSADANADEADPNSANNIDNTGNDGTAGATAEVSLTKTLDTAGPYYIGNSVTFTINVANAGPSTATNINVTDTPANLTITGVSGACASFPCMIASLASGANTNITVTATIDAAGAFDNAASATAAENDNNTADNSDNAGDTALASADVSVTKTLDTGGPYSIGQSVTYTIVVANAGPSTATNIQVTDTPANLTITGVSGACASFPCTITSLASGASTNITVTATIDSSGSFSNTATANGDEFDPDTNDNSSTDTDVANQINVVEVTKAVSGTFVQGTNVTYTIVMTNTMTVNQPDNFGHEFTDILPAGLTLVPGSFTATSGTNGSVANIFFWDGSIPSGGTVTLTFQATISPTASGQICNQGQSIFDKDGDGQNEASELTDDPDTVPVNDSTCFYVVQSNVVEVTKAVSGTFVQGTNITYTIVMTNNMTVTQPDNFGHEFTDILPAGLTLVPGSFTATSGTNGSVSNIFFWDGSIPSGGTVTLTFQATISPTASGQICNQGQSIFDRNGDGQNEAEEKTDDPSTAADDDFTCFYVVQANVVEVTKAVSGTFVQGTNVTYTIVMTNNMTVTQPDNFGHEFTDNLPAGLTLVPGSFTATSGTNGSVANIFFWDGSIPSGGTVTLTFQATIGASATGTICNQGQSIFDRNGDGQNEASELTDDPSTGATNDATCFTVIPTGIVSATKSVSGAFTQGSNVTYTIIVTNNMGITQPNNAGDELTDVLPPSLTLVSANATSGTANANVGTNTVTWNGSLAAGASVTITITATINNTATGAVSNQADIDYDADGNGSNEASGVSDDPSTGAANDPTVFTISTMDSDGDGVDDAVEQAAPNGGDGNGDGIPDYQQSTVASIPAATGSGYLTLQSSCALQNVEVVNEDDIPVGDHGHRYPHGLIAFRAPCSSATFSLFIYGSGAVSSYRKYGPLPPGGPAQWYQLPGATFQVVTVGSLHPRRVDFSLTDGGTGDDTPVDGVIVDQGGPADPDAAVPTASEWALLLMAAMLAMAGVLVMKR